MQPLRITAEHGRWKLTPDRKLTIRFDDNTPGGAPASDAMDRVLGVLHSLMALQNAAEPN